MSPPARIHPWGPAPMKPTHGERLQAWKGPRPPPLQPGPHLRAEPPNPGGHCPSSAVLAHTLPPCGVKVHRPYGRFPTTAPPTDQST